MVTVRMIEACETAGKLGLDPKGFFVIRIDRSGDGGMVVEHYENVYKEGGKVATGRLKHIITGRDAKAVGDTIVRMELISHIEHAVYIGRELQKAEEALKNGWEYEQDESQESLG